MPPRGSLELNNFVISKQGGGLFDPLKPWFCEGEGVRNLEIDSALCRENSSFYRVLRGVDSAKRGVEFQARIGGVMAYHKKWGFGQNARSRFGVDL